MKKAGLRVLKSIHFGLAVLLCTLIMLLPTVSSATPSPVISQQESLHEEDLAPAILFAGECAAGEMEGLSQLSKFQWAPCFKAYLLLLYPRSATSGAAPNDYPASKGDCGLHTILTKGP